MTDGQLLEQFLSQRPEPAVAPIAYIPASAISTAPPRLNGQGSELWHGFWYSMTGASFVRRSPSAAKEHAVALLADLIPSRAFKKGWSASSAAGWASWRDWS